MRLWNIDYFTLSLATETPDNAGVANKTDKVVEYVFPWSEKIGKFTGISESMQINLFQSAVLILLIWLLYVLVVRIVWKRTEDVRTRYLWRKSASYVAFGLTVGLVGMMYIPTIQSMATFLGLVSAGVAIALRDVVTSVAGWVYILAHRPFVLGNRIQIGEHSGDVIDISVLEFTLMEIGNWVNADQSTGRVIHIPNAKVFTLPMANYSRGFEFIWNEIPVLVTFESNWEKAKAILQSIADSHSAHRSATAAEKVKEASRRFMIHYQTLTPIVYTSVEDCGVSLTIRYLSEPRSRRTSEQAIWEEILGKFAAESDIEFAYPTQRFYRAPNDVAPPHHPPAAP
jgi:small-conductance mechanosensitive channel